jgi:hypothetical protein
MEEDIHIKFYWSSYMWYQHFGDFMAHVLVWKQSSLVARSLIYFAIISERQFAPMLLLLLLLKKL